MKKIFFLTIVSFLFGMAMGQAQTIGKTTIDQYKQLLTFPQKDYESCNAQVVQWGYEINKGDELNMFTMVAHPYVRMADGDTLGAMLAEIDGVVYSVSGIYSSASPSRTFSLIVKAAELQQQLAVERGLTKYVCMIKGDVKNKRPKTHEELMSVLSEESSETVRMVMEMWKSEDGNQSMTLNYDNKRYGKKKARDDAYAELSLGLGVTPSN